GGRGVGDPGRPPARPAGMAPPEADRLPIGRAPDGHDFRRPGRFIAASGSRLRVSAPARRLPLELAGRGIRWLVIISGRSQAGDRAKADEPQDLVVRPAPAVRL